MAFRIHIIRQFILVTLGLVIGLVLGRSGDLSLYWNQKLAPRSNELILVVGLVHAGLYALVHRKQVAASLRCLVTLGCPDVEGSGTGIAAGPTSAGQGGGPAGQPTAGVLASA